MRNFILLMTLASFIWACGSGATEEKAPETTTPPATEQTAQTNSAPALPAYPTEKVKVLFDSCDYVDVIFYYEEFSINQKNQKDIRGMLNYISSNPPASLNESCQPIGRIFFQIEGRNAAEADIFFQQECLYFLFYEDNKYAYSNNFTQSGVNFFSNIFAQVNARKNAGQ